MNYKPFFANFGAEKMIYDDRMKPQALYHEGFIYIVYQANQYSKQGHPFVIRYDIEADRWDEPIKLGYSSGIDHHFAPIIWIDQNEHFHVLYDCHFNQGTHLICRKPGEIDSWMGGPVIARSITYPRLWYLPDGRLLLFFRVEGHLGYWAYKVSEDGGMSWSPERAVVDFNREANDEADSWAGSYHGAEISIDGKYLHLGFVYWDERDNANPVYRFKKDLFSRYNLYYAKVNLANGKLESISGQNLPTPINRKEAEQCKIMDSGHEITNFPTLCIDSSDNPYLLMPVSEDSPWKCSFYFFKYETGSWMKNQITSTDSIWSGSYLEKRADSSFHAFLISGKGKDEQTFYGGGSLQHWESRDHGDSWQRLAILDPDPELIYNNPRPIITSKGNVMEGMLVFYGWKGPEGIWDVDSPRPNRGMAYFWKNGIVCGINP